MPSKNVEFNSNLYFHLSIIIIKFSVITCNVRKKKKEVYLYTFQMETEEYDFLKEEY